MIHWLVARPGAGLDKAEFLLPEELAEGARFRHPGRRRQWLLGRAAAKVLLLRLRGVGGNAAAARSLRIVRQDAGWPQACTAAGEPLPLSLSISHSGERALCAVCPKAVGALGADLEKIEPRSAAFLEDFYTEAERRLLSRLSGRERETAVNAVWSLKEALLKALWSGLRRRATDIEILSLGALAADGWRRPRLRAAGRTDARGLWRTSADGRFVLALGLIGGATS